MYGFGKHIVGTLTAIALVLPSYARAEGYPDRNSGLPDRPSTYYGDVISAQRKASPQGSGESDAAYQIRINRLERDYALDAPSDSADPNGGVDRAEKLADAAVLAGEGNKAATTQSANLIVWAMTQGLSGAITAPGTTGGTSSAGTAAALADIGLASDAGAKYQAIQKDMELAAYHNRTGKSRLRFDPDDNDPEAGTPSAAAPAGVAQAVAASLSDSTKAALKDRGLDPEAVVERLLSGEVDTSDPAAFLKELGDTRTLSVDDLAEAKRLADVKLNDPNYNPLDLLGEGGAGTGGKDKEGSDGRSNKLDKDKDPSQTTNPGLAGIAIRLINRDVMGFKLGEFLGFGEKKAQAVSAKGRSATGRGLTKGAGKKSLTASDFYRLKDNGVTAPRHGSNIFTIAHRQYRDFTKWRTVKKGRVAANR